MLVLELAILLKKKIAVSIWYYNFFTQPVPKDTALYNQFYFLQTTLNNFFK